MERAMTPSPVSPFILLSTAGMLTAALGMVTLATIPYLFTVTYPQYGMELE
jgi:hypothetical protein